MSSVFTRIDPEIGLTLMQGTLHAKNLTYLHARHVDISVNGSSIVLGELVLGV